MTKTIKTDLCVIGGGLAGICAAVSAARNGIDVVLVQDRPVLGGNASSEIRMWVRGVSVNFPEFREGGIVEELAMDNTFYNPTLNYAIWDGVLYNKVRAEKNITLLLNTTCMNAEQIGRKVVCVDGWQLTTYTRYKIYADFYADCSGDGILAEFTDAEFRYGRESFSEFQESGAAKSSDKKTMGNSCLIQTRETTSRVPYIPLPFKKSVSEKDLHGRMNLKDPKSFAKDNFWWIEKGGSKDALKDAEDIRNELIPTVYGVWDFIKNGGVFDAENWELDFVGQLVAKRESRRYIGDYILTQNDIEKSEEFFDEVAYGGWKMDDHNPDGIDSDLPPNTYYEVKKPYAIPYRTLYSKNVDNLYFAGRNISVTHMALSSTRVMATCAMLGQAVGTAASLAKKYGVTPRGVLEHIDELQRILRDDDCYLLHTKRKISGILGNSKNNLSKENSDALFDGEERKINGENKRITLKKGEKAVFEFSPIFCNKIRLVFDNDISRECYDDKHYRNYPAKCSRALSDKNIFIPPNLVKEYEYSVKKDGEWTAPVKVGNHLRLNYIYIDDRIEGISFRGISTYGCENILLYSIDVKEGNGK